MALSPVLAPGVERVVDEHAVLEHFVVILVKARQAERDREQPGGLRREIETVRICAAHDDRELPQCRIFLQAEEFQEGIEAAFLAGVGELDVGDIIRLCILFRCNSSYVGRGYVQELGVRVDEAADQPRAGDAVDLRTLSSDPARGRIDGLLKKLAARFAPGFDRSEERRVGKECRSRWSPYH